MENIKEQLEEVIKKNLPEKKEITSLEFALWEKGFNQALSQIDTSLIADEVLKVVVGVANNLHDNFEKQDYSDAEYKANFLSELRLQLLTNSPE